MRQVPVKRLEKNLSEELRDLPFEIVRFGRVIALISPPSVSPPANQSEPFHSYLKKRKCDK